MTTCPTWVPADPAVPHRDREPCTVEGHHPDHMHSAGLRQRWRVERLRDPHGIHADCRVFVLDPLHDHHARVALAAYADSVAATPRVHPYRKFRGWQLVSDLRAWLRRLDRADAAQ